MIRHTFFLFFLCFVFAALKSQENINTDEKVDKERAVLLRFDNDLFAYSDDYYTNGLYAGYIKTSDSFADSIFPHFIGRGLAHLPGLNKDNRKITSGFSLAHRMFTPHDIENLQFIPDDLPYSGQFTLNLMASAQNLKHLDAWTFALGVTGPITRAGELQTDFHFAVIAPDANGWDYQLENEALFNLFYEHRYKFLAIGESRRAFDITLIGSSGLGNLTSFLEGGITFRCGWNIPNDFYSPTSIYSDPMIGIIPTTPKKGWFSCYFFGNLSGALVLNNISQDGNTFISGSPHVEYDHFGLRLNGGMVLELARIRAIVNFSYAKTPWVNPFDVEADSFGQVSLVYFF